MEHTFMMTLDYVGDQEAIVHAQLGHATSCAHHCDVTGTEMRHAFLFERAAS